VTATWNSDAIVAADASAWDSSDRSVDSASKADTVAGSDIGFTTFSVSEKVTSILRVHERSFSTTAAG
jgi:hypothetical protein